MRRKGTKWPFVLMLCLAFGALCVIPAGQTALAVVVDPDLPTVELSGDTAVSEGDGQAVLTVTLSAAAQSDVTVDYQTSDGSAEAEEDYIETSGTLTIPAGSVSRTIEVSVLDDAVYELNEDFSVTLYNPSGAALCDNTAMVVTIHDDDPMRSISYDNAELSVSESTGRILIPFTLENVSGVPGSVASRQIGGTASQGDSQAGSILRCSAYNDPIVHGTFNVYPVNDTIYEGDETVILGFMDMENIALGEISTMTLTIIDDDPMPTVSVAPVTANESGGTADVAVSLSNPSAFDITIDYATSDGTATDGRDYTGKSGTLTIPAGQTGGTISIDIANDSLYNNRDRAFTLTLSDPVGATLGADNVAAITIVDDEPEPSIGVASADISVNETDGSASIGVVLSNASEGEITVAYATANDTASAGSDYTQTSGTLTIPSGETSASISVPILDDSIYEYSEKFTVTLSGPSGAALGDAVSTVTIQNDDAKPVFSFDEDYLTLQISEGTYLYSIPYTLTGGSAYYCELDINAIDGTAIQGSEEDYLCGSIGIYFYPSNDWRPGALTIRIMGDTIFEGNETFTIQAANPRNCTIGNSTVHITIVDNDPMPEIGLDETSITVNEDDATADITVSLTAASGMDTTVNYAASDGTATNGADYTAASGTLTIPAGEISETITVDLLDNSIYEGDETFTVTLSNPQNATLGTDTATVTIAEDDPMPTVGFSSATQNANETDGTVDVTVSLSAMSAIDTTVQYATADGTATGGTDYTAKSGTLTIHAGETSAVIPVAILNDDIYEHGETFSLSLSNPEDATLSIDNTIITIADDDAMRTIGFDSVAVTVNESDGSVRIPYTLFGKSAVPSWAKIFSSDGSATAGPDYDAFTATINLPAGESDRTLFINIPIIDDPVYEGNQTFTVTFYDPVDVTLGVAAVTVTIIDDDPMPEIGFDPSSVSVDETDASATLIVALSGTSEYDTTVQYATSDGTAKSGEDYALKTGTLTIPAGETSGTIDIDLINDDAYDNADETFSITLSDPSGATLGADTATVTIEDDERLPSIGLFKTALYMDESATQASFTVTLSGESDEDVTIGYATTDGTAKDGADYAAANDTLTIPAGQTSGTITIDLLDDDVFENGDETFTLTLSNPAGAALHTNVATITIVDDETKPIVGFTVDAISQSEGTPTLTLTVGLSGKSVEDVTVDYETYNGTATAGADYTAASGALTIPAGQTSATVNITLLDDATDENHETFKVQLSGASGATMGTDIVTVTILDNDAPLAAEPTAMIGPTPTATMQPTPEKPQTQATPTIGVMPTQSVPAGLGTVGDSGWVSWLFALLGVGTAVGIVLMILRRKHE